MTVNQVNRDFSASAIGQCEGCLEGRNYIFGHIPSIDRLKNEYHKLEAEVVRLLHDDGSKGEINVPKNYERALPSANRMMELLVEMDKLGRYNQIAAIYDLKNKKGAVGELIERVENGGVVLANYITTDNDPVICQDESEKLSHEYFNAIADGRFEKGPAAVVTPVYIANPCVAYVSKEVVKE